MDRNSKVGERGYPILTTLSLHGHYHKLSKRTCQNNLPLSRVALPFLPVCLHDSLCNEHSRSSDSSCKLRLLFQKLSGSESRVSQAHTMACLCFGFTVQFYEHEHTSCFLSSGGMLPGVSEETGPG